MAQLISRIGLWYTRQSGLTLEPALFLSVTTFRTNIVSDVMDGHGGCEMLNSGCLHLAPDFFSENEVGVFRSKNIMILESSHLFLIRYSNYDFNFMTSVR